MNGLSSLLSIEGGLWAAVGAVATFLGNLAFQRRKHSDEMASRQQDREDRMATHSEGLAIELLKMAKSEATSLRQELNTLQLKQGENLILERKAGYLEEAFAHIEALLEAPKETREGAEHNARVFLARMVGLREIRGRAANAEQVARARPQGIIEQAGE